MRKIIIILVAIMVTFSLSSCGETPTSTSGSYADSDRTFLAEVTPDSIKIYLTNDGTSALYWDGTWDDGQSEVTSDGNRKALDKSLFGSQSATKKFAVTNDDITFEFKVMGASKDMKLEKIQ